MFPETQFQAQRKITLLTQKFTQPSWCEEHGYFAEIEISRIKNLLLSVLLAIRPS